VAYEWFPSFDAIPGVAWQPLLPVTRSNLKGVGARPQAKRVTGYGTPDFDLVEWFTPDGRKVSERLGSPAGGHWYELQTDRDLEPQAVAQGISEMLALPGSRSDYHFGMLGAWRLLHESRRDDLTTFGWIEALCLADISLMEQGPQLVFTDQREDAGFAVTPAFAQLSSLYQREGFLASAVEIEQRCAALGAIRPSGEGAIARQMALLEEDDR
jgi:hypothetical protein